MSAEKGRAGSEPEILRPAAPEDCDAGSGTFLQTGFWGAFKSEFGWRPLHFVNEDSGIPLLVLERNLARGFSFAYIPRGPGPEVSGSADTEDLRKISEALRPRLSRSCVFLRMDLPWYMEDADAPRGIRASTAPEPGEVSVSTGSISKPPEPKPPFLRARADVQPPDTVVLDLRGASDEDLLSRMKPKWRYNIKYSEKKGVVVDSETGPEGVATFYSLYRTTARRDRIALHPEGYYRRLLSLAKEYGPGAPDIRVWIARYRGEPLAAIITSFLRGEAVYLYGASGDEHRNLMPAYALQWAAIRAARDEGCGRYDLFGIPPSDDPGHPMAGLYRFKTGFGGRIRRYAGSWDYPLRRPLYSAYRVAEGLRTYWYKRAKKRLGSFGR